MFTPVSHRHEGVVIRCRRVRESAKDVDSSLLPSSVTFPFIFKPRKRGVAKVGGSASPRRFRNPALLVGNNVDAGQPRGYLVTEIVVLLDEY